jgi:hypothetical protein
LCGFFERKMNVEGEFFGKKQKDMDFFMERKNVEGNF